MRKAWMLLGGGAAAAVGMVAASSGGEAQTSGPVARYVMDASTTGGMPGMGGADMMAMMTRGRMNGGPRHSLELRLGSSMPAAGAPKADHFMPQGMQLGASVPLASPAPAPSRPGPTSQERGQFQRPKGRLLIFWGCGPHAGPGQPIVIDFAKVAAGQMPPGLTSSAVPVDRFVDPRNSRSYGEWPNSLGKPQQLKSNSSLLGEHRIAGNYSPDIKFALTQDFMPELKARAGDAPGGAMDLSWNPIAEATGYYAMAVGAKDMRQDSGDMVWWTSAARQEFYGGFSDYIAPATVQKLIAQKLVMPPSQTNCTIPAEVKAAAGPMLMTTLTAYGPEQNFSYPPRPANPKTPWKLEWTAKARFKSTAMIIPGMPGMGADADDADADRGARDEPKKKKRRSPLGGLIPGF